MWGVEVAGGVGCRGGRRCGGVEGAGGGGFEISSLFCLHTTAVPGLAMSSCGTLAPLLGRSQGTARLSIRLIIAL